MDCVITEDNIQPLQNDNDNDPNDFPEYYEKPYEESYENSNLTKDDKKSYLTYKTIIPIIIAIFYYIELKPWNLPLIIYNKINKQFDFIDHINNIHLPSLDKKNNPDNNTTESTIDTDNELEVKNENEYENKYEYENECDDEYENECDDEYENECDDACNDACDDACYDACDDECYDACYDEEEKYDGILSHNISINDYVPSIHSLNLVPVQKIKILEDSKIQDNIIQLTQSPPADQRPQENNKDILIEKNMTQVQEIQDIIYEYYSTPLSTKLSQSNIFFKRRYISLQDLEIYRQIININYS